MHPGVFSVPPGPGSSRIVSPGRLAANASARELNCDRYQWQPASSSGSASPALVKAAEAAVGEPRQALEGVA